MTGMSHFDFWCYKVLPLVYDESLSYYEILCKVVDYINQMIEEDKSYVDDIEKLRQELKVVQDWIANFDTSYAEKVLSKYIATMIFVEISDAGYIIYYIPEKWEDITFNTTGLDIELPKREYGRLVLSY